MKIRSPQQKKALSYAKDRRNSYGESDKGARKSICRHKTLPTRAYRHKISQFLKINETNLEVVEDKVKSVKRKKWKKCPDISLKEWIENRFEYRRRMFRARLIRQNKIEVK
ncbi:MAG: hypothetical protein K1X72_07995 [Pyrinomonadaceae bacterium]|nr:hypothetical protein [Pyrinomonadaceae bacterium]